MATGLNPLIITCYYLELSIDCDSLLPPPCVRWAHHPGDYQSTGHDCVHAACCRYYAINFRSYTRHLHLLQWNNIWGMLTKQSFDWLPSLSLNPVTRSVPWIACGYTGHIFSLEGNKYVIPSSPDDLPVVILVIYIYFICEKKKFFWLQQVLSTLIWYVFGYCMCSAVKPTIFTVLLLSYNNWGV